MTGPDEAPRSALAALRDLLGMFHAARVGASTTVARADLTRQDLTARLTEVADLERADAVEVADLERADAVEAVARGALDRIARLVGREGTSLESIVDRVAYLAEQQTPQARQTIHSAAGDVMAILDQLANATGGILAGTDLELVRRRGRRALERINLVRGVDDNPDPHDDGGPDDRPDDAPVSTAGDDPWHEQITAANLKLARVREQRDRAIDLADGIVRHAEDPGLTSGVLADMRRDVDRLRRIIAGTTASGATSLTGQALRELREDLENDRQSAREDGDVKRAIGLGDALNRVRALIARHPR